ncbi:MAG: SirB2 family protein [Acidiferrobacterales bacterium]
MNVILWIHVFCVIATISGFIVRGIWMMADSPLLHRPWVRVTPHIVDTLLLVAGATLAVRIHQYPGVNRWLTAKTLGLVGYILLGTVALKRGKTKRVRVAAWIAGLLVFSYITAVALTRDPLPLGVLGAARAQFRSMAAGHPGYILRPKLEVSDTRDTMGVNTPWTPASIGAIAADAI